MHIHTGCLFGSLTNQVIQINWNLTISDRCTPWYSRIWNREVAVRFYSYADVYQDKIGINISLLTHFGEVESKA